jgi:hypothetical protein
MAALINRRCFQGNQLLQIHILMFGPLSQEVVLTLDQTSFKIQDLDAKVFTFREVRILLGVRE